MGAYLNHLTEHYAKEQESGNHWLILKTTRLFERNDATPFQDSKTAASFCRVSTDCSNGKTEEIRNIKTFEQRQREYNEARLRITGKTGAKELHGMLLTWEVRWRTRLVLRWKGSTA
ncbi:hypothetical protein ACOME3_003657 [Neoechinorhynchus agilis]